MYKLECKLLNYDNIKDMNMSKDKKIIFGLVGIIIFLLVLFYFQNEKEVFQEREELAVFVKEHNASIVMGGDLDNQEGDIVKVIDFSADESNSQEETLEMKEDTERKIIPYTKPLPELPNEEENNSTLYGVDSNENGVRDDLEIAIVKEFGYDREIVEVVFAEVRSQNYNMYLAENFIDENGKIPLEYEEEITGNIFLGSTCRRFIDDSIFNRVDKQIFSNIHNTHKRESLREIVGRSIYGGTPVPEITQKTCQDFIQKTKDKYSNF